MTTSPSLRAPGQLRIEAEAAAPLGHCLSCHRGVFLAIVKDHSGEPQGYCHRCAATPILDRRTGLSEKYIHELRRATDGIGRGTNLG